MAFDVVESNRLEELIRAWENRLEPDELFGSRLVFLPSRHLFSVFKNALTRLRGAFFQTELTTLDAWLSGTVEKACPGGVFLDADGLSRMVFQILPDDESMHRNREPGMLWQMSRLIGRQFHTLHMDRPPLPTIWNPPVPSFDGETENQLRRLFQTCLEYGKNAGMQPLMFPDEWVLRNASDCPIPPRMHVFVTTPWPMRDRLFFQELSEIRQVHLYVLTGCMEFFEKVESFGRPDPETRNHPLLNQWGRQLGSLLLDVHAMCDYQSLQLFAEPPKDTVLGRLQGDILLNRPPQKPMLHADESLRIWSFPSLREQCAEIADDVIRRLEQEPDLTLPDIAILVPENKDGLSPVEGLLDEFLTRGSFALQRTRWKSDSENRMLQAVQSLLELPLKKGHVVAVRDLLRFVLLTGWTPEQMQKVEGWIRQAGVVRGWRNADFINMDRQLQTHSWEQGLWRMAQGSCMSRGGPWVFCPEGSERVALESLGTTPDDRELMVRAMALILALEAYCREARTDRTVEQWMVFFREAVTRFMTPLTDRDNRVLERVLDLFGRHESSMAWKITKRPIPVELMVQILREDFASLSVTQSLFNERGIFLGGLDDCPLLPFVHVYVVGMEDGVISREPYSHLDLRTRDFSRSRDTSPREAEMGRLLELVCHTRKSVTITWCSRNPVTGDDVPAASVVRELVECLDPDGKKLESKKGRIRKTPLPPENTLDPLEPSAQPPSRVVLNWTELADLFLYPMQVTASSFFPSSRLDRHEVPEEEPNGLFRRQFVSFLESWMDELLQNPHAEPGQRVRSFMDLCQALGHGPSGVFEQRDFSRMQSIAGTLCAGVNQAIKSVGGKEVQEGENHWIRDFVRFEPGLDPVASPGSCPALRLAQGMVQLKGSLPWASSESGTLLFLEHSRTPDCTVLAMRACVAGWMLALLDGSFSKHPKMNVAVVAPYAAKNARVRIWQQAMANAGTAKKYLETLASETQNPRNLVFWHMQLLEEMQAYPPRDFDSWYLKRAKALVAQWREVFGFCPELDPLRYPETRMIPDRALDLVQRLYLDPSSGTARVFQAWMRPAIAATGVQESEEPEEES